MTQPRFARRTYDLITRRSGGELLVYDTRADRVHLLTSELARVWEACEPGVSLAELAAATGSPEEQTRLVLGHLVDLGLVEASGGFDRRSLLARGGLIGAGALAVTVLAPLAHAAATGTNMDQITTANMGDKFLVELLGGGGAGGFSGPGTIPSIGGTGGRAAHLRALVTINAGDGVALTVVRGLGGQPPASLMTGGAGGLASSNFGTAGGKGGNGCGGGGGYSAFYVQGRLVLLAAGGGGGGYGTSAAGATAAAGGDAGTVAGGTATGYASGSNGTLGGGGGAGDPGGAAGTLVTSVNPGGGAGGGSYFVTSIDMVATVSAMDTPSLGTAAAANAAGVDGTASVVQQTP